MGGSIRASSQCNAVQTYNPKVLMAKLGKARGGRHVSNYLYPSPWEAKSEGLQIPATELESVSKQQNKKRTVDLIQLLEGFPSTSEILGVIHSIAKLSVEVQVHNACNPTTLEVEAGRPRSLRTSLAT